MEMFAVSFLLYVQKHGQNASPDPSISSWRVRNKKDKYVLEMEKEEKKYAKDCILKNIPLLVKISKIRNKIRKCWELKDLR